MVDQGSVCQSQAECDDGVFCNGMEDCAPTASDADASGCVASPTPPCPGQACVESSRSCEVDCSPSERDADNDGHASLACGGDDCDDNDADRFPTNPERCDALGHDEDCDAATLGPDLDLDLVVSEDCCYAPEEGPLVCGTDCDDGNSEVLPGAADSCNDRDDDCDGETDEDMQIPCWVDGDGDSYALFGAAMSSFCGACPLGYTAREPGVGAADCNDSAFAFSPAQPELCDVLRNDENCSGVSNEDCDCDAGDERACSLAGWLGVCGETGVQTCVSGMYQGCSVQPTANEVSCDGADEDCNGVVDDGVKTTCWADADRDSYATSTATTSEVCGACPLGTTSRDPASGADCRENDAASYPGAAEVCDRIDNNCSGGQGGPGGVDSSEDADGDGHTATGFSGCSGGFAKDDCNDANSRVHPLADYQTTPRCADTERLCFCANETTTWCQPLTAPTWCPTNHPCPPSSAQAPSTWDFNCDGAPTAPSSFSCAGAAQCAGGCPSGSGYDYAPGTACGTLVAHFSCECAHIVSSVFMCQPAQTQMLPLPCR